MNFQKEDLTMFYPLPLMTQKEFQRKDNEIKQQKILKDFSKGDLND